MEELNQPIKPNKKWRGWIKPIIFTTLLYVGLGGVVYCSYGAKNTQPPKPTQLPSANPTASQSQVVPPTEMVVANELPTPISTHNVQSGNIPNGQINSQSAPLPPQQSTKPALQQVPPIEPLPAQQAQNNDIAPLSQSQPEQMPPQQAPQPAPSSKNDPRTKAMSKAEEEAEAQNEMLREAIDKVKKINDNKIAKSREEVTESSVAAYPSIIKDDEKSIQIDDNNSSTANP